MRYRIKESERLARDKPNLEDHFSLPSPSAFHLSTLPVKISLKWRLILPTTLLPTLLVILLATSMAFEIHLTTACRHLIVTHSQAPAAIWPALTQESAFANLGRRTKTFQVVCRWEYTHTNTCTHFNGWQEKLQNCQLIRFARLKHCLKSFKVWRHKNSLSEDQERKIERHRRLIRRAAFIIVKVSRRVWQVAPASKRELRRLSLSVVQSLYHEVCRPLINLRLGSPNNCQERLSSGSPQPFAYPFQQKLLKQSSICIRSPLNALLAFRRLFSFQACSGSAYSMASSPDALHSNFFIISELLFREREKVDFYNLIWNHFEIILGDQFGVACSDWISNKERENGKETTTVRTDHTETENFE